jgi:hypothetical protein
MHSLITCAKKTVAKVKIAHPGIPRIPAKELAQLLKNKADIVVVDTQASDGYEMWHIPSAVNITYVSTEDPTHRQRYCRAGVMLGNCCHTLNYPLDQCAALLHNATATQGAWKPKRIFLKRQSEELMN